MGNYQAKILTTSPIIPLLLERLRKDKAQDLRQYEQGEWEYNGMEGGEGVWWSEVEWKTYLHISATMPRLRRKEPKPRMTKTPRNAVRFDWPEGVNRHTAPASKMISVKAYTDTEIMIFKGRVKL